MTKPLVLVVDDEDTIRNLLKSRLERDGFDVITASGADQAEKQLASPQSIGVMITDIKMPGKDGITLARESREKYPGIRVIVITGHGEKELAVESLRVGATDYLEKPFDMDELSHTVSRCVREYRLEQENRDLVQRLEARIERVEGKTEDQFWFVSKARAMTKVNEWLNVLRREAMRGDAEEPTVLITGDSGTGKEGIARMIHAGSRRGRGPWVAVNCANFTEQLLESELFGHEKGAFTGANTMKRGLFEIAKGGTLFLDEIGEMDVKLQARLLRVLQEKTFRRVGGTADLQTDVRIVTATNRDLGDSVRKSTFREDLYHRLNKVVIELPRLRDRTEDIVPMARQFSEHAFRARGKTFEGFSPDAEQALGAYHWPGNIREMLNVVERVALTWNRHGVVTSRELGLAVNSEDTETNGTNGGHVVGKNGRKLSVVPSPFQAPGESGVDGFMELKRRWTEEFEREYLQATLRRHGGNVSAAAREAQLDRSNFLRLLRKYGLRAQEYRKAA